MPESKKSAIVSCTPFRSSKNSKVNCDDDMIRIVIDLPKIAGNQLIHSIKRVESIEQGVQFPKIDISTLNSIKGDIKSIVTNATKAINEKIKQLDVECKKKEIYIVKKKGSLFAVFSSYMIAHQCVNSIIADTIKENASHNALPLLVENHNVKSAEPEIYSVVEAVSVGIVELIIECWKIDA